MILSSAHDRAFFICKELLMTERTYKKDVEVLAEHFRRELITMVNQQIEHYNEEEQFNQEIESLKDLADLLFTNLVPIYNFHSQFLRQLEQRMSVW